MTSELLSLLFSFSQAVLAYMLVLSLQLLAIMVLRKPAARHFGAVTAYRLWALPLLWLPFHWVSLPAFDWNTLGRFFPGGGERAQGVVNWVPQALTELDFALPLPALDTLAQTHGWVYWSWLTVSGIWLGIAVLLLLLQIRHIRQFARELSALVSDPEYIETDVPLLSSLPVYSLQGLSSPALFGVFHPRLLLPADFEERFEASQRALILRHEAVHLQRHDNLWNLLATLLRVLFWFNPLLHVAWKRFRLDQELSCDERVLQETGPDKGKQYARMLLESMRHQLEFRHQPTITAWGSLREIRERTHMIRYHLNNKPRHRAGKWLLLGCVLCGSVLTALHHEGFREVVAAENIDRPANTLTREVYERIEEVMTLRDQADYEEALNVLDEIRAMYEQGNLNNYEAYMMFMFYGSIAMEQEQYESSIDHWEEALQQPDLSQQQQSVLHLTLGQLHFQTEDFQAAIDHFMTHLELTEEPDSNTYLRIAYAYSGMERYEEAISWAEQAMALDENTRGATRLLHSLYQETGREEEAQETARIIAEQDEERDRHQDEMMAPESVQLSSSDYLPTTTVPPGYPDAALEDGIEGWVQVGFTVNEEGEVIDPVVVDAEPEGYFEESSLTAIREFRFEPKQENGSPVETEDVQYVFTYRLDQE